MRKKIAAFSLLEMLIVLTILGILCAATYPSYSNHLLQQKRFIAKATLFKLATALENYFNIHDSYQNANLENLGFQAEIADNSYVLRIQTLSATQFVIAAVPTHPEKSDTVCGTFLLNSLGEKKITGTGSRHECW
jgi:type IV pilus assembly protein PilE